ncbi:MAG: transketolase family protein [Chloroflexota bacterium]|nr:MAG: transketolase [Chloroflexota bacterium]
MLNPDLHLNSQIFDREVTRKPTRNGFGEGLVDLGDQDPNVVALCGDLTESTRNQQFASKYPERFFELGVAEQNMAAVAAGLAVTGKVAFISSYATFSPGKNWETLRTTAVYNDVPVKIAGHHSGIATGQDGATHQATEDIAITRVLPGLDVVVPCDSVEARKATVSIGKTNGPSYIRFTRDPTPVMTTERTPFDLGAIKSYWVHDSPKATILACGYMLYYALLAAQQLDCENVGVLVANVSTIKPLDTESLAQLAKATNAFVTVEDHQVAGGLGGAVAEWAAKTHPLPIEFIGLQDMFAETGKPEELVEKYGMGANSITEAVKRVIGRK